VGPSWNGSRFAREFGFQLRGPSRATFQLSELSVMRKLTSDLPVIRSKWQSRGTSDLRHIEQRVHN
jgi:hypothetical protein